MYYLLLLLALLVMALGGCTGPGILSTVTTDVKDMLRDPAVQATIQSWSTNADITNPSLGFYAVTGGELRTTGVILRGNAGGAGSAGLDAETLNQLKTLFATMQAVGPPTSDTPLLE